MSVELRHFKAQDLRDIALQESQAYLSSFVTPDMANELQRHLGYTALVNGVPIASAGIIKIWPGRAMAWAYLAEGYSNHFISVHRAVKNFLEGCSVTRLEATVDCDFEQGHRWMRMLGFTLESERMVGYRPDGGDCALYARITR